MNTKQLKLSLLFALLFPVLANAQQGINTSSANNTITSDDDYVDFIIPNNTFSITITLSGTFISTNRIDVTAFNNNWTAGTFVQGIPVTDASDNSSDTTQIAVGSWILINPGWQRFRVYGTNWTSGTVTVNAIRGSQTSSASFSGSVSASAQPAGDPHYIRCSDGSVTSPCLVSPSVGGITGTIFDLANSNPLATQIVDANGTAIVSFGGGTQYTEGDIDATITGNALLFEGAANTLTVAPGTTANGLLVDVSRVSGTVTISGTVTSNLSATDNAVLDDIADGITVTGPLTDAQLRATAVPVSGTITANLSATDNAVLDSIVTLLNGGLPAALGANGGLKVESALSDVIDGDPVSGGPASVFIGCRGEATPAVVGEDDKSDASCTLLGAFYVATNGTDPLVTRTGDPCSYGTKINIPISQAASTELFTGTASNRTYICNIVLTQPAASTQTFSLVSGTGTVCATSTGAMIGATTAANGVQLPFAYGNGAAWVAKSDTDADNICLLQSTTDRIAGNIVYVVAAN